MLLYNIFALEIKSLFYAIKENGGNMLAINIYRTYIVIILQELNVFKF